MIKILALIIVFFLSAVFFFPFDTASFFIKSEINKNLNEIFLTELEISPFKITAGLKFPGFDEQIIILKPSYLEKTVAFEKPDKTFTGGAALIENTVSINGNLSNFRLKDDLKVSADFSAGFNFKTFEILNASVSAGEIKGSLNTPFGKFNELTGTFNLEGNNSLNGSIILNGPNYTASGNVSVSVFNIHESRINFSSINYDGQEFSNISLNLTDLL